MRLTEKCLGDFGDHVINRFVLDFQIYLEVCLLKGEFIDDKLIQIYQAFAVKGDHQDQNHCDQDQNQRIINQSLAFL